MLAKRVDEMVYGQAGILFGDEDNVGQERLAGLITY
jgi:hypothetical protein